LSFRLIKLEVWWKAIGVQELRRTIKEHLIHFGYLKMNLVSNISESIGQMGTSNSFTTDISEWLHIGNDKEAY